MDKRVEEDTLTSESASFTNYVNTPAVYEVNNNLSVPKYLDETYWWAYLHPKGVAFFDKPLIVNGILFGNYRRLRDSVIRTILNSPGNVLQLAAVYGNISPRIAKAIAPEHQLDVVDVAEIQLKNLSRKVTSMQNVYLHHQDASSLELSIQDYEYVLLFFILHEVPDELKRGILREAFAHCKPGGKITIVDYHKPVAFSPMRYLMWPVLATLEPFALPMWHNDVRKWLPDEYEVASYEKKTYFGGLYQKIEITLAE